MRIFSPYLFISITHPQSPAHLNDHNPTLSAAQTESFTFPMQDAHHATRPAIQHSLHSVAHEPDEEPNRLQGGGSHRRGYDCHHVNLDNSHTHIDDVPLAPPPLCCQAHHSADALLLSTVLDMLWLGVTVPPCMHVFRREGACLFLPQKCGYFSLEMLKVLFRSKKVTKIFGSL